MASMPSRPAVSRMIVAIKLSSVTNQISVFTCLLLRDGLLIRPLGVNRVIVLGDRHGFALLLNIAGHTIGLRLTGRPLVKLLLWRSLFRNSGLANPAVVMATIGGLRSRLLQFVILITQVTLSELATSLVARHPSRIVLGRLAAVHIQMVAGLMDLIFSLLSSFFSLLCSR